MLAALLIVALQLIVIYRIKQNEKCYTKIQSNFNWSLLLTLIQIFLGTSVREHVDRISETGALKYIQDPKQQFFTYIIVLYYCLLTNLYLFSLNRKLKVLGFTKLNWVLLIDNRDYIRNKYVLFWFPLEHRLFFTLF
jgi:cytochrome c oxidase assembly protein subunit 15